MLKNNSPSWNWEYDSKNMLISRCLCYSWWHGRLMHFPCEQFSLPAVPAEIAAVTALKSQFIWPLYWNSIVEVCDFPKQCRIVLLNTGFLLFIQLWGGAALDYGRQHQQQISQNVSWSCSHWQSLPKDSLNVLFKVLLHVFRQVLLEYVRAI